MSEWNDHMWEVTRLHKGENGENVAVELQDPDGWFDVNVRWDGMMELHLYHNVPKGEQNKAGDMHMDTVHIADLAGFIRRLQELQSACQELFDYRNTWHQDGEADMYDI